MTEVLPSYPGIHRSHTTPASTHSNISESKQEKRVRDWQFNVAQSNASSKAPSNAGSIKSSTSSSKGPPPSLPHSKSHTQRSAVAKSTTSSFSPQEQFKQVPSLHASRLHEDYEFDYDGHITPPLGVSRIVRRETTTTTCDGGCGFDDECDNCTPEPGASRTNIRIQNVQQDKEKEDDGGGISGKTVVSALLGAAAGAAVAYAVFNKFTEKKEEKKEKEREEPIRMVSRSPSVSGNKTGLEKSHNLDVIDEDRRADHETFRPEARLAIMQTPFYENVWADDKRSKVSKHSARRSMDMETLVDEEDYRSVVGSEAKRRSSKYEDGEDIPPHQDREAVVVNDLAGDNVKNLKAESSMSRSRAPESYVSARSHISASSARRDSQKKGIAEERAGEHLEASSSSSGSGSEPEQEIHTRRGSRLSVREVAKPESVVSHRSRRSHGSARNEEDREHGSGRKSRKTSVVAGSDVSHGSREDGRHSSSRSRRSHVSARDIPLPSSEVSVSSSRRNRSKDSTRSSRRRSHASGQEGFHDDGHHHRDPHEIFRETEHSTDAIIGANFAAQIASIAGRRRRRHSSKADAKSNDPTPHKSNEYTLPESTIISTDNDSNKNKTPNPKSKSRKHSHGSHVSAHEIPLPDSDARSCLTAREIPLPESELGGARVIGGVYGGGGLGLGLGNRLSARFVELPESEVGSSVVLPEDSISNVGGRRHRRR